MFKKLSMKFAFGFIALALSAILLSGIYLMGVLDDYFMDNLRDKMLVEARLIQEMVIHELDTKKPSEAMEELAQRLGKITSTRITLMDDNGVVLGDSQQVPTQMENHLQRPEIQEAIHSEFGIAERDSSTLGTKMMYLALQIREDGESKGFIRLALPMKEVTTALSNLWRALIAGLFLAVIFSGVIGLKLAQRLTKPIQEMTEAASKIANGNFELRTYTTREDEIGVLGQALNKMAQQLKETINEVSDGKRKLESVLDNMVSGVIFIRQNEKIDLINPAAGRILGINPIQTGRQQTEVILNYQVSKLITLALQTGKSYQEDLLILYPHEKNVEVNITPITGSEGSSLGVVVVLHDITDFRRLERMRKDFVANVSHELNTPVTSLKGYAETLLDGALEDPEVARDFVQIILDESERLRNLISDLLELSRIESAPDLVKWQTINVKTLLKSMDIKFKPQLETKKIDLDWAREERYPNAWGDPFLIGQVLTNLIDNAIKYSPEGSKITVRVTEQVDGVLFEVSDEGPGIPPQDLDRIFERFYRLDKGRSRKLGGTGLGLSIVKHILEAHGSEIKVESTLGRGSNFYFFLPKKQEIDHAI